MKKYREFETGESVYYHPFMSNSWWRGKVVQREGDYYFIALGSMTEKVHVKRIKERIPGMDPRP